MTSTLEKNEEDLIRECANSPFEHVVILALKQITKTVKNQEEKINALEKGGK